MDNIPKRIRKVIATLSTIVVLTAIALCFRAYKSYADVQGGNAGNSPSGLVNPLNNINSVQDLLLAIVDILLVFAIPIVVFFIIYAGFKFVTAQGDTGKIAEARSAFTWAVVGGVIVLGAKLLAHVIQQTVNQL
jgi:hypothetical protein